MCQWALQRYERAWGPNIFHRELLEPSLRGPGRENVPMGTAREGEDILYKYQGKLDEAEKMYQRAVQGEGMGFPQLGQPLLYSGQARRCRDVPVGIARIC